MAVGNPEGSASFVVQIIPWLVISLILVVPFVRILHRSGRSGWWVLLLFVPFFGWLILPWVIAFMRWETPDKQLDQVFR